jgi:hypothetical protein
MGRELRKELPQDGEFDVAFLLVDDKGLVREELYPVVIETGDIEAAYSKVYSPDGHPRGTIDHFNLKCLVHSSSGVASSAGGGRT